MLINLKIILKFTSCLINFIYSFELLLVYQNKLKSQLKTQKLALTYKYSIKLIIRVIEKYKLK